MRPGLADALRISQIPNNLMSNALKFTTNGYVDVRAELPGRAGGTIQVKRSHTEGTTQ